MKLTNSRWKRFHDEHAPNLPAPTSSHIISASSEADIIGATTIDPQAIHTASTYITVRDKPEAFNVGNNFNTHPRVPSTIVSASTTDTKGTLFLGESNHLTCVASDNHVDSDANPLASPEKSKLSYLISEAIDSRASRVASSVRPDPSLFRFLTQEGAFIAPDPKSSEQILSCYFKWFHPSFPIVDKADFYNSYRSDTLSQLLFQAMLFIGATYCSEKSLYEFGLKDRHAAKAQFYYRAKLLYDADWETNKVVVIQSLFLMSFWRAGPVAEKDTRHWLGIAINLAQTQGFHRSGQASINYQQHRSLRRTIWWSLYIRDRQCSAAYGLPSKIRDEDCDVAMLERSDIQTEAPNTNPEPFDPLSAEHANYFINMAKLAILLGRVVSIEFAPKPAEFKEAEKRKLIEDILIWKSQLPVEMRIDGLEDSRSLWTNMLHLAYNDLQILVNRSTFIAGDEKSGVSGALKAACKSTRILEDMLSQDILQHGQVNLISSSFSVLCMHTIHLRRSQGFNRRVAEQRAQVCIFALKELQKTWDINNWVLQLFFRYLDNSIATKLHIPEDEDSSSTSAHTQNGPTFGSAADEAQGQDVVTDLANLNPNLPNDGARSGEPHPYFTFPADTFRTMSYDEGFDQYFGPARPGIDDLNAQDLDILSRCLDL